MIESIPIKLISCFVSSKCIPGLHSWLIIFLKRTILEKWRMWECLTWLIYSAVVLLFFFLLSYLFSFPSLCPSFLLSVFLFCFTFKIQLQTIVELDAKCTKKIRSSEKILLWINISLSARWLGQQQASVVHSCCILKPSSEQQTPHSDNIIT